MFIRIYKDRALMIALGVSFIWHLFWILAIKVVVAPRDERPVKFSGVAFLGPLLERGALDVRIEPRSPSVLEKRFLIKIGEASAAGEPAAPANKDAAKELFGEKYYMKTDKMMQDLIRDSLDASNMSQGYGSQP